MAQSMTLAEARSLIANAPTLQDLYASLVAIEEDADEDVRADIDYSALPTFGGAAHEDTQDIWSWDEEQVLACDSQIGGSRWMLCPRVYVTVTNPWTGADVQIDLTRLSADRFDAWVELMDDDVREELHRELEPCAPAAFIAAFVERVGQAEAGRVLLS